VGAAGNLPRAGGQGSTSTTGNNNTEETIQTDFAVSKTIQEFEDKMGAIERLTVAALVDLSTTEKGKDGPMTLADVQDIIKQAVGFKPLRDEIKVSDVKLTAPAADPTADEEWHTMQKWQNVVNIVRNASLGVTALVALLMGWMFLRRFKPAPTTPQAAPEADTERTLMLNRMSTAAERNPQGVALALETWLAQPERSKAA